MGRTRMMEITLTKCSSLSEYGCSQSGLVQVVEMNVEGALQHAWIYHWQGTTYQQTKAECLVHVTEAEMP